MKKLGILLSVFLLSSALCFSQAQTSFTIQVQNVAINGGTVYIAIFANEQQYRDERPFMAFDLAPSNTTLFQSVTLPAGEYFIAIFQDANGNVNLDRNLFGIPRELFGISNWDGRGTPSLVRTFDRHKIRIDSTVTNVSIGLFRL